MIQQLIDQYGVHKAVRTHSDVCLNINLMKRLRLFLSLDAIRITHGVLKVRYTRFSQMPHQSHQRRHQEREERQYSSARGRGEFEIGIGFVQCGLKFLRRGTSFLHEFRDSLGKERRIRTNVHFVVILASQTLFATETLPNPWEKTPGAKVDSQEDDN